MVLTDENGMSDRAWGDPTPAGPQLPTPHPLCTRTFASMPSCGQAPHAVNYPHGSFPTWAPTPPACPQPLPHHCPLPLPTTTLPLTLPTCLFLHTHTHPFPLPLHILPYLPHAWDGWAWFCVWRVHSALLVFGRWNYHAYWEQMNSVRCVET